MGEYIETEFTFEPAPDVALPDLTGIPVVATVTRPQLHRLEAVYFDTEDLRLARSGVTLRRRTGGDDAGWHLKIPTADGIGRTEVGVALGRSARRPPTRLRDATTAWTRGASLVPVATISTRRRIRRLRDERRGLVAELCEDTVHGVCHLPGYERETAWTEWELELGPGAVEETVEALVATLTEASGGPSTGGSKLRRTVGDAIPSGGVVPELGQAPSARAVVHARIAEQVRVLLIHDSEVRRDVGDGVHKARVAMRRLRAALATFRPWLDRDATDRLRDELRWAGRALSPVRDAEVMRERFAARLDDQPRAAVIGSVRRDLDNDCRIERRDARKRALELMVSVRYLRLLSRLDAVVGGELGWGEHEPGRKRLRRRTEREWVRVHGRYDAAYADAQGGEPTAAALHEVRKAVKRLRYAGEAVEPMFGRAAATLAAHAEEIQTVLGEHQDSVVAQRVLRDLALAAHRSGTDTFTYGRLHGLEDGAAAATRHRFAEAWSRLEKLDPSTVLR